MHDSNSKVLKLFFKMLSHYFPGHIFSVPKSDFFFPVPFPVLNLLDLFHFPLLESLPLAYHQARSVSSVLHARLTPSYLRTTLSLTMELTNLCDTSVQRSALCLYEVCAMAAYLNGLTVALDVIANVPELVWTELINPMTARLRLACLRWKSHCSIVIRSQQAGTSYFGKLFSAPSFFFFFTRHYNPSFLHWRDAKDTSNLWWLWTFTAVEKSETSKKKKKTKNKITYFAIFSYHYDYHWWIIKHEDEFPQ